MHWRFEFSQLRVVYVLEWNIFQLGICPSRPVRLRMFSTSNWSPFNYVIIGFAASQYIRSLRPISIPNRPLPSLTLDTMNLQRLCPQRPWVQRLDIVACYDSILSSVAHILIAREAFSENNLNLKHYSSFTFVLLKLDMYAKVENPPLLNADMIFGYSSGEDLTDPPIMKLPCTTELFANLR